MKEHELKRKVTKLKKIVGEVNALMAELQDANVEVRINYIDAKGDVKQGIALWRIVQHNDYLI